MKKNQRVMIYLQITCDINCNDFYDYDDELYSLTIYDEEDYYVITIIDNKNDIDLSLCNDVIECDNNSITGYVEK